MRPHYVLRSPQYVLRRARRRAARVVRAPALATATVFVAAVLGLGVVGCGLGVGTGAEDPGATQARILEQAQSQFGRAADGLLERSESGFEAAVPASRAGRASLRAVYDALAPLPWRAFEFEVTPLDPATGLYRVRGTGQLGPAGPPDRIAVVRHLVLESEAGGVRVVEDKTPRDLRRRSLMALHDPVVLQRPGLIVLGDHRARDRAAAVMAAAVRARPRLAGLGLDIRPTVAITVFASAEDVRDGLGVDVASARLTFFAYPVIRVTDEPWPTRDVGVMGPWLRDLADSMPSLLAHELAHAYTLRWFASTEHVPVLLVEGIAQAAEGASPHRLREEVATGNQLWPLPESFAAEDMWDGNSGAQVSLGYEVGGSLVSYVLSHWGAWKLRPFVQSVADAEPTEVGVDAALTESLGVSWHDFYAGWRRYVLTGE